MTFWDYVPKSLALFGMKVFIFALENKEETI